MFHPLAPIFSLLFGLLSLAVLGYGGHFLWEYWDYVRSSESDRRLIEIASRVAPEAKLWWGLGLLAFSGLGRFLVLPLLGRSGTDDPKPARSKEVRVLERPDGAKIHVEFFGREDAPPIVLTHGFSNDSTTWYYLKRLQEEFRLIVWDLRGVGFSEGSRDQNYALEAMAGDLRAVLDLAGPDRRPLLVGHSMGGMIALTLLRDAAQRERIAGLVLLNTTYTNPTRTCSLRSLATALQKPVLEPVLWLNNFVWPLTWLANWSSYSNGTAHLQTRISAFAGNQTRGQVEHSTRMSVECSPKVLARQALGMLRYEARDVLPQVDLPALVITAPKDTATEPDASEFLQRTLPKAKLVTVEGAAHASMDEQGPAVCAIVSSFATETFASLPPRTNSQEPIIQGTL